MEERMFCQACGFELEYCDGDWVCQNMACDLYDVPVNDTGGGSHGNSY